MIETREALIKRVSEILSKKSFTEKAKDNLLRSIVFIFDSYSPPKYILRSRNEYIMEYLEVLENMNGYAVVGLSEINDPNDVSKEFRDSIVRLSSRNGNLDLVDGKYVPAQNGEYYCVCKGFAWINDQMIFSLEESDVMDALVTVYHEMTHLTEGENPFPIDGSIPFSFELRKMFSEGRAATNESYLSFDASNLQINRLEDKNLKYQVVSNCSYPLYGKLYQILQIIFGDEILEKMGKNDDKQMDMIKKLEEQFPDIPIKEVFSHLIYILSCKSKRNKEVLVNAIYHFARSHAKKIEGMTENLNSVANFKSKNESYLENLKKEEYGYTQLLGNPHFLKQEYEKVCQEVIADIEDFYRRGIFTEEEYQRELELFRQEGTLEYYKKAREQDLQNNRSSQERMKKDIIECEAKMEKLQQEKKELEQNHFSLILERVCLKKPSLQTSFSYLENLAFEKVYAERKKMPEGDPNISIVLDKARVLFELKEKMSVVLEEKKASLVS